MQDFGTWMHFVPYLQTADSCGKNMKKKDVLASFLNGSRHCLLRDMLFSNFLTTLENVKKYLCQKILALQYRLLLIWCSFTSYSALQT